MVQPIVTLRMLYLSLLISLISTTSYTKRWNTVFVAVYYAYFMYTSAHTARGGGRYGRYLRVSYP